MFCIGFVYYFDKIDDVIKIVGGVLVVIKLLEGI